MWRLLVYTFILIWAIFSFPRSVKKYAESHEVSDLLEIVARVILIPSGAFLIISWFVR